MATPLKARTLIADDHAILRQAVKATLDAQADFEVVAEAGDGAQAVELALRLDIDLAVMDISMPRMTGIDAARRILEQRPETRIVFLTMHEHEDLLSRALAAGASGYVVKSAASRDLLSAARAALRGETFLYPQDLHAVAEGHGSRSADGAASDELSDREREVLKLVAEGHTNEQIGAILHISPKTVARHRANTLAKLGMRDRVELTRYAIRRGLIEP